MRNELLLIASLVFIYGSVLVWYRLWGTGGLMALSVLITVVANIEVMLLVRAFGMEMTLGNILFAATFVITDILSEVSGRKAAQRTVWAGIGASIFFLLLSQSWLLYRPAEGDWAMPSFQAIFSNTPRMMFASLAVYALVQMLDVWLYHWWWDFTTRRFGDRHAYLWLRNNGSTLISQLANAVLFTLLAFWGIYDGPTLISIILSSYVIFIFTSLLDTPVVYLARRMYERRGADPSGSA